MTELEPVLAQYPGLAGAEAASIGSLINETYRLTASDGERFILQRIHPVFHPEMHSNIEAVTRHLRARGLRTPELVPAGDGRLWIEHDGGSWRLQTFVPGATFHRMQSAAQARATGELVGRFHGALTDLDHRYVGLRDVTHDVLARKAQLQAAIDEHRASAMLEQHGAFLRSILAGAEPYFGEPLHPPVVLHGHGDLKISNILFAESQPDEALCLIDLDTLGPISRGHELGDAWRSWCNPNAEDVDEVTFDLAIFEASWRGYLEGFGRAIEPRERYELLDGPEEICFELTTRFAADVLNDRYFGWDPERFASRAEHNLARANTQWALYRAVVACRAERAAILGIDDPRG